MTLIPYGLLGYSKLDLAVWNYLQNKVWFLCKSHTWRNESLLKRTRFHPEIDCRCIHIYAQSSNYLPHRDWYISCTKSELSPAQRPNYLPNRVRAFSRTESELFPAHWDFSNQKNLEEFFIFQISTKSMLFIFHCLAMSAPDMDQTPGATCCQVKRRWNRL